MEHMITNENSGVARYEARKVPVIVKSSRTTALDTALTRSYAAEKSKARADYFKKHPDIKAANTASLIHTQTKKYGMWLNYDNDRQTFMFPMLPEEVKMTCRGKVTSIAIDRLGELLHKGKRDAATVTFSSTFPNVYGSYCSCPESHFKKPAECREWILKLMNADNPAHLVLTGSPMGINGYFLITNFVPMEVGGDVGSIAYSIELKESRAGSVNQINISKKKKQKNVKKTKKTTSGKKRVNNTATTKTYTIKSGDTLWAISIRYYGTGTKYSTIYSRNKTVLDSAARKHGYRDANGGNYIWPGTRIVIP